MENHTCKSCGKEFSGNYCNYCGEKVIRRDDRTLKYFLGEFINALTFADNKLWRSVKYILIKPGELSKNFAEGRRRAFMKPVSVFFLANLIYFLFPLINTFTTNLNIQSYAFVYSPTVKEWVAEKIDSRGISFETYEEKYNTKTTELSKLLIIVMALMVSVLFVPIHLGSQHNLLADHFTAALEVMSFVLIFCLEVMGLVFLILSWLGYHLLTDTIITSISCALLVYFFSRMEYSFYGFRGARLALNVVLDLISIVFALSIYRALLFFITFWSI